MLWGMDDEKTLPLFNPFIIAAVASRADAAQLRQRARVAAQRDLVDPLLSPEDHGHRRLEGALDLPDPAVVHLDAYRRRRAATG